MSLRPLTIHYLSRDVERLDAHVDNGEFTNRSEAVRYIIKEWLDARKTPVINKRAKIEPVEEDDEPDVKYEIDEYPNRSSKKGDGNTALPAVLSR